MYMPYIRTGKKGWSKIGGALQTKATEELRAPPPRERSTFNSLLSQLDKSFLSLGLLFPFVMHSR